MDDDGKLLRFASRFLVKYSAFKSIKEPTLLGLNVFLPKSSAIFRNSTKWESFENAIKCDILLRYVYGKGF